MEAVILAAGLGTRFILDNNLRYLPEYVDKMLLPLGTRPILGHVLEEIRGAGIRAFVLVVSRHRSKEALIWYVEDWAEKNECSVEFVYQMAPLGTADALFCARKLLGREFAVFYGDDLWLSEPSRTRQLLKAYEKSSRNAILAAMEVGEDLAPRLGILRHVPCRGRISCVKEIREKPKLSELGGSGPYLATISGMVLTEEIFPIIEAGFLKARKGEYYLTEALNDFAKKHLLLAAKIRGHWVDCGTWNAYVDELYRWSRLTP